MNLNLFLISGEATLRAALEKITINQHGFILSTDPLGSVNGLATDGDIRDKLLSGVTLDEPIKSCVNINFVWAPLGSSRESLLKKLDHQVRFIPILDAQRRLVDLVSSDRFPIQREGLVYARARAPVRVSFGGGGSDLTHYFRDNIGAVINATISLYSHATLRLRNDKKIVVQSRDIGGVLVANNFNEAINQKGSFGLIQALLRTIAPDYGFELYLHSDFPMKSGLGGSAVVSAAILGCFNQFRRDQWDLHELAEIAYQAERVHLGIAGGWQDQYATIFGGFNFMEFGMEQNIVHPLRIHADYLLELEESLVLCDTRTTHDSGDIHQDQHRKMQQENIRQQVKSNVDLTYKMRNQLLRGNFLEFGRSMHQAWQLKKQFSKRITTPELDSIYDAALNAGAIGGKLLGAGGGGFFIFYVPPYQKLELMGALQALNQVVRPFRFESAGLCSWTARESNNYLAGNY